MGYDPEKTASSSEERLDKASQEIELALSLIGHDATPLEIPLLRLQHAANLYIEGTIDWSLFKEETERFSKWHE